MKQATQVILTVITTFAVLCAVTLLCIVGVTVPGTSEIVFITAVLVYSVLLTVASYLLASKKSDKVLLAFLLTTVVVFIIFPVIYFITTNVDIQWLRDAGAVLSMILGYPAIILAMAGSENSGVDGIAVVLTVALIPALPIITALITKKRKSKEPKI